MNEGEEVDGAAIVAGGEGGAGAARLAVVTKEVVQP
jgi:hypothetical protein